MLDQLRWVKMVPSQALGLYRAPTNGRSNNGVLGNYWRIIPFSEWFVTTTIDTVKSRHV